MAKVEFFFKIGLIFVFLFGIFLEIVGAYPHYLSYFNQFGGGTAQGYRNVTDSNYDWGQDLKLLKDWAEKPACRWAGSG